MDENSNQHNHNGAVIGIVTSIEFRDAAGDRVDLGAVPPLRLPLTLRLRLDLDGPSHITLMKLQAELMDRR